MTATAPAKAIVSPGDNPKTDQPEYQPIRLEDLKTSPTNPRRRINDETIASLAQSIRTQGVLEPLIVRRKGEKFEIVCGERRYRAAEIVTLTEVPCLIRELSEEQVLDIQIHENLHREDVHPMDEAYGYQYLREKLNCDVKELALRVGKPEGYILNRLKLNHLIKDAQKDIDEGHLPISYALEMAKYSPDIQTIIYAEVYKKQGKYEGDDYVYVPIKGETIPWKTFIDWINTNIHRLLVSAPFNPKATNLRSDGLACVKCPERTGAVVSLFEANQVGKKDACLNPACFVEKAHTHIDVRRQVLAGLCKVEPSEIPLVRSSRYSDGENYLGSESATVISGTKRGSKPKTCARMISAIDIEPENYGQTVEVCLKTSACKVHWPESKTSTSGRSDTSKSAEQENTERLESHRARREEIWNAKVAEAVRIRVFKDAAESFEKKFRLTDVGTDLLPQLIAKFWRMTSSGDSNNLNVIVKNLVGEWQVEPKNGNGLFLGDSRSAVEQIKKLERGAQFRILFLLIHGHKGTIFNGNNYSSQKEVRELAGEFSVNYPLLDAEVRLDLCAKKHNEVHEAYLKDVTDKTKDAKVPRLFSEKWSPTD